MVKATTTKENIDDGSSDERNDENSKVTSKCSHIAKSVDFNKIKKYIKQNGFHGSCLECDKEQKPLSEENEGEYDKTLWMCLKCGLQLCGRFVREHAKSHYEVSKKIRLFFI